MVVIFNFESVDSYSIPDSHAPWTCADCGHFAATTTPLGASINAACRQPDEVGSVPE